MLTYYRTSRSLHFPFWAVCSLSGAQPEIWSVSWKPPVHRIIAFRLFVALPFNQHPSSSAPPEGEGAPGSSGPVHWGQWQVRGGRSPGFKLVPGPLARGPVARSRDAGDSELSPADARQTPAGRCRSGRRVPPLAHQRGMWPSPRPGVTPPAGRTTNTAATGIRVARPGPRPHWHCLAVEPSLRGTTARAGPSGPGPSHGDSA